jgi:hypothetical protein
MSLEIGNSSVTSAQDKTSTPSIYRLVSTQFAFLAPTVLQNRIGSWRAWESKSTTYRNDNIS